MTEQEPTPLEPGEDEHALVGAYALDAVEPAERAEFERHLAGCPLCTVDVPAFREVIAVVARSSATAPPERVIVRALTRARSVRQERPGRGGRGRWPGMARWLRRGRE